MAETERVTGEGRRLSEGQVGSWEPVTIYLLREDVELSGEAAVAAVLFEGESRPVGQDTINHQERKDNGKKRD